jgi:ribosomal protein L21E
MLKFNIGDKVIIRIGTGGWYPNLNKYIGKQGTIVGYANPDLDFTCYGCKH